jgi:hypothetical protein
MFKCNKCKKEFKYESDYKRHQNRKTDCNQELKLECKACNMQFNRMFNKLRHEKTNKHITNYNKYIQTNVNGDNIAGDKINNIINLTLNVNSFKNTDLIVLRKWLLEDIGENLYEKTMAKTYLTMRDKIIALFKGALEILEKVHFNLEFEDNHNCKILLMFPGIKKKVYEYLILEVDAKTNKISWISLEYKQFITEIINQFTRMNKIVRNEKFQDYLSVLEKNILYSELSDELKPLIEQKLGDLYINFNKEQKKPDRVIENDLHAKIKEYTEYRFNECKLNNGYNPEIINPQI